jgi:phage terminase large subunit-like protein
MPWQQAVADVVLEVDPSTGRLVYDEFGLTVPRQSGKSTFVLAKSTHRCSATGFFGPRQRLVYTAQTRQKARAKWDEDFAAALAQSPAFKSRVRPHRGPGNEHLRFANGSKFGIEANTEKAGHGDTLDEAYIDEAFAQADFRLEQAFGPAMITRINKQLGWISTAGWVDASPYLQAKVAVGRAVVDDPTSRIAYFEWAAEDDCDPGDPAVWWGCMPALGYTISEDAIRGEYTKAVLADKLNDFRRAYLNLWVQKDTAGDAVISLNTWFALADRSPNPAPHVGRVSVAVDSDPNRGRTSIVSAGLRADGVPMVELVENLPGVDWAAARLREICERNPVASVAIDKRSAAASLIAPLEAARVPVVGLDAAQMAQACGQFYDAAMETGLLRHLDQLELAEALKGAVTRPLGDAWAWDRKKPTADITPLTAATLALWGFTHSGPPRNAGRGRVVALT